MDVVHAPTIPTYPQSAQTQLLSVFFVVRMWTTLTRMTRSPRGLYEPRNIGQALVFLRIRAGMTRDEACERSGISKGTLSRYENNMSAHLDMTKIAAYIDVLAEANDYEPDVVWRDLGRMLRITAQSAAVLNAHAKLIADGRRRRVT